MRLILTATVLLAFAGLVNADDCCRPKHRLFDRSCKHGLCGHSGLGHGLGGHFHNRYGSPSIGWWGTPRSSEPPNPYLYWHRYNRSPRDFFMADP